MSLETRRYSDIPLKMNAYLLKNDGFAFEMVPFQETMLIFREGKWETQKSTTADFGP